MGEGRAAQRGVGFVALWLNYDPAHAPGNNESRQPAIVEQNYRMLVMWSDNPAARKFFVYDKRASRVFVTSEFDMFLRKISALPCGAAIFRIEKCGGGFSDGSIPESAELRIRESIDKSGKILLKWPDEFPLVCTCESTRLDFPDGSH